MKRKLNEMNQVVESVINKLDNETILFVMGDHGMSEDGNHGGATVDETKTILFSYSNREFNSFMKKNQNLNNYKKNEDNIYIINQIDFVPTLSMIFGLPIPYSNLGHFFNY